MLFIDSEEKQQKMINTRANKHISQGLIVSYPIFFSIPVYIATVYLSETEEHSP